jgi:serine/threonine-protein kinase
VRRDELIGRTIANRFHVKRVLGEGGMATVFVAEQDAEPREIALKILRADLLSDKTFAKRFEREAKAAARVQHPNSVAIFDSGVEGSISYIAMELLRGDDLYALLERHRALSPRAAATIVAEVCDALTVAHGLGIVHRDLKPENIMIVRDAPAPEGGPESVPLPNGSRVKVLDFGIAKLLDRQADVPRAGGDRLDPPTANTAVTRVGTLIGTPAYMSPEQCALLPVDTRSDIYTCGVLLFQMVTGRLPFEGPTPLHIATKHIHEDPPALRAVVPEADASLEAVILKALAKRPADRWLTARALGTALRKLLPALSDAPYASVAGGLDMAATPIVASDSPTSMTASPGSEAMASAKTVVAEGVAGPPPSVLVHNANAARRPIAVLARHPTPEPAAEPPRAPGTQRAPEPEPARRPIAVLARHPVAPSATEPGEDPDAAPPPETPTAPGVEAEPEDLASTLVRGTPGEVPEDLMKTRDSFLPGSGKGLSGPGAARQLTMQSAASPPGTAERAARISVVDLPVPASQRPTTPAVQTLLSGQAQAKAGQAPAAAQAQPQAQAPAPGPAAPQAPVHGPPPTLVPVPAKAVIPQMPSASVILSPSLAVPIGPPPPAPLAAPPPAPIAAPPPAPLATPPISGVPSAQGPIPMSVPVFGLPAAQVSTQVPVPAPAATSPVVGRALWLGILIGVLGSAVVFGVLYALLAGRG